LTKNFIIKIKKLIDKFIYPQDEAKIIFEENSISAGCVEIFMECMSSFEQFPEYLFRKLGKVIIVIVKIIITLKCIKIALKKKSMNTEG
jgi:hypothetical protein